MIIYLLDTSICIYIIKKNPIQILKHLKSLDISEVGISSITLSELEYGISNSTKPKENKLALAKFLAPLEILPYNDASAEKYGIIRSDLDKIGIQIEPLNTLIAAHALALKCTLVTNNTKEFECIKGLQIENWI
jgi:tRNA(fMet)-specific endonuclease VapC